MKKQDFNLHIIGAGVNGPIAARVLEDNGFSPVVNQCSLKNFSISHTEYLKSKFRYYNFSFRPYFNDGLTG